MTAGRDMIGRVVSRQVWVGGFFIMFLLNQFFWVRVAAAVKGEMDSRHLGAFMLRPLLWVCLSMAFLSRILTEVAVAAVARTQKGISLSIRRAFLLMHKPGMQCMMGKGKGYDESHAPDTCKRAVQVAFLHLQSVQLPCGNVSICLSTQYFSLCPWRLLSLPGQARWQLLFSNDGPANKSNVSTLGLSFKVAR